MMPNSILSQLLMDCFSLLFLHFGGVSREDPKPAICIRLNATQATRVCRHSHLSPHGRGGQTQEGDRLSNDRLIAYYTRTYWWQCEVPAGLPWWGGNVDGKGRTPMNCSRPFEVAVLINHKKCRIYMHEGAKTSLTLRRLAR